MHFQSLSKFGFAKGLKVATGVMFRKATNLFSPYELIAKTTFDMLLAQGADVRKKGDLIDIAFKPEYAAKPVHFHIRPAATDIVIFNEVLRHESYKPAIELQKRLNLKVEYIIDAGANVGSATVYFKTYYPASKIVAVEPADSNAAVLQATIAANGYTDVKLFKGALWNKNEKLAMKDFFRGDREKELSFYVEEAEPAAASDSYVEGATIEHLMELYQFPRIDILKIDIEGAETKIFTSPDQYLPLLSKVGILAIEIHEEVFDKWKFVNELEQAGYSQINIGEILYVYKR